MSYLSQFNYKITGPETGRKWIFLHGLMGFGQNWRRIVSALEATEHCLVYDQRGHGKSFQPATGYSPEDYADDLKLIADELGWDQFVLVGHSMGGRNVLNFASRFPEMLTHLVIEDIGPEANPENYKYYEQLLGVVPTPFASRSAAKEFFSTEFPQRARTREKVEVIGQYLYANLEEKADGTVDWRFSREGIVETVKAGHRKNRWEELRGLKVPTLLVRGAQSPELSHGDYVKMLESNPMIKGVEIPEAGHWVHSDRPQAFIEALKNFTNM